MYARRLSDHAYDAMSIKSEKGQKMSARQFSGVSGVPATPGYISLQNRHIFLQLFWLIGLRSLVHTLTLKFHIM